MLMSSLYKALATGIALALLVTAVALPAEAAPRRASDLGGPAPEFMAHVDLPDHAHAQVPENRPGRGMVWDDIVAGDERGPCHGLFELPSVAGEKACTHGPDEAPQGVDVAIDAPLASSEDIASAGTLPCDGDGQSGYRSQAIYAVSSDQADRFGQVKSSITPWATTMSQFFSESSDGQRELRWVTNSDCSLDIQRVVLSPAGDDTFSATINEMKSLGFNNPARKYVVWMDANVYCGIGQMYGDDNPAQTNVNNGRYPMFSRVDAGCWGGKAAAHELVHNLGGVFEGAPNATANGHCTDEYDLMCYVDGDGVTMNYVCGDRSQDWLLDCGGDDYFNVDPGPENYLATHWNTADSRFLIRNDAATPDTNTTTTAAPTTTTTAAPATTTTAPAPTSTTTTTTAAPTTTITAPPTTVSTSTTETFIGKLAKRRPTGTHTIDVEAGQLDLDLAVPSSRKRRAPTWDLRVQDESGTVLGQASGRSSLRLTTEVPSGTIKITVSGGSGSYTLTSTTK